jgi:hypothetical protein
MFVVVVTPAMNWALQTLLSEHRPKNARLSDFMVVVPERGGGIGVQGAGPFETERQGA